MPKTVAILGGGVGGLSAAHELAERGFQVHVYERKTALGGKARSLHVPNSATNGRAPLPGEHGFRFFPGFYKHITDTMRRTPYGAHGNAFENLAVATRILLARAGQTEIAWLARSPATLQDFRVFLLELLTPLGVPPQEVKFFISRLLVLRYPAVLMSAGHTTLGKTENHRMAANLAAKGFVALAYDPVGLGERMQAYDRRVGRGIAGCCANEHLQAGAQSILIGQSVARYFIKDAMRALDYLLSRPEADPTRVGAAGCSGGGCLTTYIAALDPRVKVAAPACFLNSLRVLFTGPYPDSEMSLPRFLASGLDHADFLEVSENTPWLIQATEGDFFTPAGVEPVYEEARRWYRLYGAEDKVQLFMGRGPHGTPLETREALYGWMIRWLKDGKGDARELEIPLYPDHELQVTKSGQVEDEPVSRWLYEVIREEFRARKQPRGVPELLGELRRLQIPSDGRPPALRSTGSFESEPGVTIGGRLYLPGSPGRKPALLLVKDRTSTPLAEAAVAKGNVVLELEPRDSPSPDNRPFLGNWMVNARANAIGRNLPAMRAHDILRGVDLLSSRDDVDPAAIRAAARDVRGVWLLLAAAVDPRIGKIWLDRTPHSLSTAMDSSIHTNLFDAMIPGFLLHWDLADLVKAMGARPVLWTDPANWMNRTVPLGAGFRYRYSEQTDEAFLAELLQ